MNPFTLYSLITVPITIFSVILIIVILVGFWETFKLTNNKNYLIAAVFMTIIIILIPYAIIPIIIKYGFKDFYRKLINHKDMSKAEKKIFNLY